jgi:hypothetical protein
MYIFLSFVFSFEMICIVLCSFLNFNSRDVTRLCFFFVFVLFIVRFGNWPDASNDTHVYYLYAQISFCIVGHLLIRSLEIVYMG